MTTIAEKRLGRIEGELAELAEPFIQAIGTAATQDEVDPSFVERFSATGRRLIELNDELHDDDFDPRALAEFRGIIINAIRDVEDADPNRPLDSLDAILVKAEQLRHIVRDALDGHVSGIGQSSGQTLEGLRTMLPNVPQREIADLLGKSQRQVQRWATQDGPPARRLDLVARLTGLLRHSWTDEGVVAWFFRPRPDLSGKKPIDLLDDPANEMELLTAARRGRAQHGS